LIGNDTAVAGSTALPAKRIRDPSTRSTVFQKSVGVPFTMSEMIGPVTGFVVLGLIAAWLLAAILRGLSRVA